MAKFDKEKMASRVKSASVSVGAVDNTLDRLSRAEAVVARQPTGFQEPAATNVTPLPATFTRESRDPLGRRVYFEEVLIEQIDPNPFNARQVYRPERVAEMTVSIASSGQLMPGLATKRGGRTVLAAGHYRWKGIRGANVGVMKLMIHEGLTDQELYQISFKENEEREEQGPLDNALSWKKLLDEGIYANESAIAEATGISLSNINKTMAILKLSEQILDLVRLKPKRFALSVLYELSLLEKAAGSTVALGMANKIAEDEAGRKEVTELRAKYEHPRLRKAKETSRQYKIVIAGEEAGFIKEWDSGRVSFEVSLEDPKARESLVQELKKKFSLAE